MKAKFGKAVLWAAIVGAAADIATFVLAVEEILPPVWGAGALLAIPILCAMFFVGVVGEDSPNDPHPNVIETFRGGAGC